LSEALAALGKSMTHRLFVYGTLAPGRPNEHVLADIPGEWEPATVSGTLFQEGWGAAAGYPGIVLDERGGEVKGFLFSSDSLAGYWARLDEFEGEGYERVLTTARRADGTAVDAYIYQLSGKGSRPGPAGGS
jgi:gamma-glutamylcyclotransferase (GGCT)/AIG2-like uncharacterized protein YtfP